MEFIATLLVAILLLESVEATTLSWRHGLLLQVDKVHTTDLPSNGSLSFDISLFRLCPLFTMIFTTDTHDSTRVLFSYETDFDKLQVKIDESMPTQSTPQLGPRECNETDRKSVFMQVSATRSNYRISVDAFFVLRHRPKSPVLKIFVPQQLPCCLIRAILFDPGTKPYAAQIQPRRAKFPVGIENKHGKKDPFAAKAIVIKPEFTTQPYVHPTAEQHGDPDEDDNSFALYSWTQRINDTWIVTFFIFSGIMVFMLLAFTIFGLTMFVCLQKMPKDADDLHATIEKVAASTINTFRSITSKSTNADE